MRGGPLLNEPQRLVTPVDAGGPPQRPALDVHVQARHVVLRHDSLVGGGNLVHALAGIAELRPALIGAPAAEGRDHIAPDGAEGCDVREIAAVCDEIALAAVPGERARRLRQRGEECECEVARARGLGGRRQAVGRPGLEVGRVDVRRQRDSRHAHCEAEPEHRPRLADSGIVWFDKRHLPGRHVLCRMSGRGDDSPGDR